MTNKIQFGQMSQEMLQGIAKTPEANCMVLGPGQKIKEHKHGNSMYYAKGVKAVTLEGKEKILPSETSWVFIPEGVSHGWSDVQLGHKKGLVYSYHDDHKNYEIL